MSHRILDAPPAPEPGVLEALRHCATADLADALADVQVIRGLAARHAGGAVLCGPALTVRLPAGHNLLLHHAIDLARPGDVIVVDAGGDGERALIGEIMTRWAARRGVAGFVVDGAVRDLAHLQRAPMPVYSRSVCPRGPVRAGGGELYGRVRVGEVHVAAGDFVVGDLDGLVSVPPELALDAAAACARRVAQEDEARQAIECGTLSRAWVREALQADRDQ